MRTVFEHLRARLTKDVHVYGNDVSREGAAKVERLNKLLPWLVREGAARLLMGQFRYEAKDEYGLTYEDKVRLGMAKTFYQRLKDKVEEYEQTGNAEMLVDAFNYILLELDRPSHPHHHFKSKERYDDE